MLGQSKAGRGGYKTRVIPPKSHMRTSACRTLFLTFFFCSSKERSVANDNERSQLMRYEVLRSGE